MKRDRLAAFLLLLLVLPFASYSFTTAILIDTSRSVPPGEFSAAKHKLKDLVPGLLENGSVTVVSFNDEPVFEGISMNDASGVCSKIDSVAQGGRYTLLYDALFRALQSFEDSKEKGAIILVSDGRDENSAVVLEDAAKKAESLDIPVITIGIGTGEKSLRRLSALTKGNYEGDMGSMSVSSVSGFISEDKAKKAAKAAEERPAPVKEAPLPAQPPPQPRKEGFPMFQLFVVLMAVLALIFSAVAVVFFLKNRKEKDKSCEKCGRSLSLWESECPDCFIKELSDTKPGMLSPDGKAEPAPDLDPELFKKAPSSDDLDSTMVLEEIPILLQMRGNQPPRMYQVSKDNATSVGRDKINGVFVDDKTLSAQHFKIAPKEGSWFVIDLDSTNGTFVDGERVKFKEIKPGSQIHAGQCQFIFRIETKRLS